MSTQTRWRASLVELFNRIIKIDKNKDGDVYWNGENNLYPNEIELVIGNSPTASRSAQMMGKFIGGKGLVNEVQDIIVNDRKNYKLSNVIALAGQNIAKQNGVWIHIGYGLDEELKPVPKTLDVLDYCKCRLATEDDDDNWGKIFYKDYTKKASFGGKQEKSKWFYPFNKNPKVVLAQIKADSPKEEDLIEALKKYRGQVYYLNLTPEYKYALSPVDSVYNDADSEFRISNYTNTQTRTAFLGKTVALTQGLEEKQEEQVEKDLANFLGSENSGSIYHMSVASTDDLDKIIKFIQLKPQFDDKLFVEADSRIRRNILGAFNNIPEPLILAGSGALFGTSAEAYTQMKLFYSEQTEDERYKLSEAFTYLGFPCEIEPIVKQEVTEQDAETKRQEAQATLRGSVGGVTALIALQQSVSQGYTQIPAAIEIIKNIYGIDEETAKKMIGDPVETAPETQEI